MTELIIVLILVAALLSYLLIKVWSLEDAICDLKVEYTKELHKEIGFLEELVDNLYIQLDKLEDDGR